MGGGGERGEKGRYCVLSFPSNKNMQVTISPTIMDTKHSSVLLKSFSRD